MKRVVMLLLLNLLLVSTLSHAGNGDLTVTGSIGVGTSTPVASAALDMTSSTKGFLPPRMTTVQRNAITPVPTPTAAGLLIYNINEDSYNYYTGTTWISLGASQGTYSSASGYQVFTASGTFNVPAGVTRVYVEAWGGGGGGGANGSTTANNGAAGGATSFGTYISAPGGAGGERYFYKLGGGPPSAPGAGGVGGISNDIGLSGTSGTAYSADEFNTYNGIGGLNPANLWGGSKGGIGGNNGGGGGGGGAYVRGYAAVTPGETVTVVVGTGGAAGAAPNGATDGTAGRLVVYW